ncbi:MAG: putative lipid II flippase FtsW [Patescibacteria group bacterium]
MPFIQRLRSLDPTIIALTVALTIFGLLMLMSASGPIAVQRTGDALYYVARQLKNGVLPGAFLFLFFSFVDYRKWRSVAFLALIVSIGLLITVFLPGIGQMRGGSRSWVDFGGFAFQPSEFVKLTFLVYLSAWLAGRQGTDAHNPQTGLAPFLLALGAIILLLIMQPDTGSMAVIVGMSLLLYLISGAPLSWFIGLCGAGVGMVALLIWKSPYRAARFMTFMHPEIDPQGIGYHINQAVLAIGSGGFWGLGYGHSRQKYLYLPEAESDSIIAVMGEELGLIGITVFLALMGYLVWRCFKIARESADPFGAYLAAGVGSWIGVQTFLNIGSMIGIMPMTGVTLPFFSHGGSSMVILLAAMGLVAGIPRAGKRRL